LGKVYEDTKLFPKDELYSLTNQLRRAAASIPSNIAEGCGKNTNLEFAHYLNIALGSANESEYFLILSKDLFYLPQDRYDAQFLLINQIKGMLITLINKVRSNELVK
jgi:four helix bundle protein